MGFGFKSCREGSAPPAGDGRKIFRPYPSPQIVSGAGARASRTNSLSRIRIHFPGLPGFVLWNTGDRERASTSESGSPAAVRTWIVRRDDLTDFSS